MASNALFDELRKYDTPTICNALEIVRGTRFTTGFTRQRLLAAKPAAAPIVGYARTATIRCSTQFDPSGRKARLLGYYEHVAQAPGPTVTVVQDTDSQPGLGAFWGEVNTTVHWGLGCVGAVTNGSMRDLDAMHPQFQCLAATLSPSHAFVHVVDFGKPVDVLGMYVTPGTSSTPTATARWLPASELEKLPAAIDLMARREKVILDAARPGFNVEKMRAAMAASEQVK